jgi:23S rRNA C2498 (ribose-2'-O)-methylase RlmM
MKIKILLNKCHNHKEFELEDLQDYQYVVMAQDKILSGWGKAKNKEAYSLVLCKDIAMARTIATNLPYHDFGYVRFHKIESLITLPTQNRIYTLRLAEQCPLWNKER